MGKVLIITDLFPPAFGPRMGYLTKYLKQTGWESEVVTEQVNDKTFDFLAHQVPVTYVSFYTARNFFLRKLQWIFVQILDLCFGYKDLKMEKAAAKRMALTHFDLVLCSSFRTFPLTAARNTARRYNLPFVVDLRDVIEQYSGYEFISHPLPHLLGLEKKIAEWFRDHSIAKRDKCLGVADIVTTVSPWHVALLRPLCCNVQLICNGYDPELFFPQSIPTDKFVITYTGRLLSTAMRDPHLLFDALNRLGKSGQLTPESCQVNWYVDKASEKVIAAEAEQYGVMPFMQFKGYVAAEKIPQILNESSILLLLTNKATDDGPKGIMTTKFYESLAVKKPILCVTSDEDCLEAALNESHAGLAGHNTDEVCDFLLRHFSEWKEKGFTTADTDEQTLRNYSRKEQAKQFAALFNQLTQHT